MLEIGKYIGKYYEIKNDVGTSKGVIKKGRRLYCYHATYDDGIWLKDESIDSLVLILPFKDVNFYAKEIK